MNRTKVQVTRRDVVFRARIRVWCLFLNARGRDAGHHSIDKVGEAIQRAIGGKPKAWLSLVDQLPQGLRGILPRGWESLPMKSGETRLAYLVNAIDSLEEYRGSKDVFETPLWPLLSLKPDVPLRLSDSVDRALEALALRRMSLDDSGADWRLVNGSQLKRVTLSVTFAARRFSFSQSVEHCLGTTAGSSHERLLRVLYALALLHLESCAMPDYNTAGTIHRIIDRVTSSAEYDRTFGCFAEEIRRIFRSRVIWRPIELLGDEPCESKTSRSSKWSQEHATTAVRVDRARIGCVIVPVSANPGQMDAHTFKAITFGFKASG